MHGIMPGGPMKQYKNNLSRQTVPFMRRIIGEGGLRPPFHGYLPLIGAICASGLLLFAPSIPAATSTISVDVAAECLVSSQDLNFGTYNPLATGNVDVSSQININCTSGTDFTIKLNAGQHSSGGFNRNMSDGTNQLAYQLYTDSTRLTIWGDGTNGTSTVTGTGTGPGSGNTLHEIVYGQLPALQPIPVGTYSDSINVTVTF